MNLLIDLGFSCNAGSVGIGKNGTFDKIFHHKQASKMTIE
jgi:hypothetical protein